MANQELALLTVFDVSWGPLLRDWARELRLFWPIPLIAFVVALAATPIARRFALTRGIVDRPDEYLKPHGRPTPYLGGVAIFAGWIAGILLGMLRFGFTAMSPLLTGVALAGFATMLIGLFDDLRVMSPTVKLVSNIGVAALLLAFGLGDDLINVVLQFAGVKFEPDERWLELTYSVPLTVCIVVGACNATNLIDGLDGLCSGVLGIISLGFVILALHLRVLYPQAELSSERIIIAMSMLGAAIGFLPYNINPAKIFMGDAGSMLLGLNAAALLLMFGEQRIVRWMIGAVMVFGLPLADMLLTMVRRWRNGKPIMAGDRSHYYDQLHDRGLTVRQVADLSYLLALAFVLVGTSVVFIRTRYTFLVFAAVIIAVILVIWKFNMAGVERNSGQPGPGRAPGNPSQPVPTGAPRPDEPAHS